jgi:hypothetical protein
MIQQILNKQLLQDVLESMRTQAQVSAADERRAFTGTPMDDLDALERAELVESIDAAKIAGAAPWHSH